MPRHTRFLGPAVALAAALSVALALSVPAAPAGSTALQERSDPAFDEIVRPFLLRHCTKCHSGEEPEAGLDLFAFSDLERALAAPETWALVRERLAAGEMPPPGRTRPGAERVSAVLGWIALRFAPADAAAADPGRPVLRRLNHTEYRNTVRDLLGVDFPAREEFPSEAVGHGFDNIGAALSLPDLLFEKYLEAAERIAAQAVVDTVVRDPPRRRIGAEQLSGRKLGSAAALYSTTDAGAGHYFPRAGEYVVRVRAWGQQAGPEVCRMTVRVDGGAAAEFKVAATQDDPDEYETVLSAQAGEHVVAARFLNDYYRPEQPNPADRDRNLFVEWIEVAGPVDPLPATRFQADLLARFPESLGGRRGRALLEHLASRAWRRPATTPEVARLEKLAPADASLEERLRLTIEALLVSPQFLFRVEEDPAEGERERALGDFELATRLSYFLWSSMPDEELFALAAAGELRRPAVLDAQARRMLAHPRSRALADDFADQWLQVRRLERAAPDPEQFAAFDEPLRAAMREETLRFFETVLREDRSAWELLDGDFTFVNEALAALYGIDGVQGPYLRRVSLAGTPRRGVLTQASVLTITSNPNRTSPVKRGKWVLENLLGAPPPDPPPGLAGLDESPAAVAAASLRERLQQHRADPACAACHDGMDPLGFGLENFDPIGAWRESADGFPVDASGVLPGGRRFDGPLELAAILREDDAFLRCLCEKLLVYALGRGLEPADRRTVDAVLASLDPDAPTLSEMIRAIIRTEAFRVRRAAMP